MNQEEKGRQRRVCAGAFPGLLHPNTEDVLTLDFVEADVEGCSCVVSDEGGGEDVGAADDAVKGFYLIGRKWEGATEGRRNGASEDKVGRSVERELRGRDG